MTFDINSFPAAKHMVRVRCSCCWRCRRGGWRTGTDGTRCCGAQPQWAPSQVRGPQRQGAEATQHQCMACRRMLETLTLPSTSNFKHFIQPLTLRMHSGGL